MFFPVFAVAGTDGLGLREQVQRRGEESTSPARSFSALRTATRVLPDPVAMTTWVRSPRSGTVAPAGTSRARSTASTASR